MNVVTDMLLTTTKIFNPRYILFIYLISTCEIWGKGEGRGRERRGERGEGGKRGEGGGGEEDGRGGRGKGGWVGGCLMDG